MLLAIGFAGSVSAVSVADEPLPPSVKNQIDTLFHNIALNQHLSDDQVRDFAEKVEAIAKQKAESLPDDNQKQIFYGIAEYLASAYDEPEKIARLFQGEF